MKPKTPKVKRVKAWAIVDDNLLSNWGISYAVFTTKTKAKMFIRNVDKPKQPKVVPCTVTYTLPTTHKKK